MSKFTVRFNEALKDKGISQNLFAKQIGFSQGTVNGWCVGRHEPNLDTIVLICRALGESADWLLGLVD